MAQSLSPVWWDEACAALSRADPVMAELIRRFPGACLASRGDAFTTLARSIVGQQISVKAAASVWGRVEVASAGAQPTDIAAMSLDQLAACGLSRRKAEYLHGIASRFADGSADPQQWRQWSDDAIIDELVRWRGIGRWTAEMFLIFHQLRPDVFPLADLGMLKAIGLLYHGGQKIDAATATRTGKAWAPWRTAATWYLWRSLDPVPVAY